MAMPAAAARAISSLANSADFPVAIDWAETACMPEPSSSVSDARKMASADPKCSTSFRDLVGPRPGVNERASHSKRWVAEGDTAVVDKKSSEADCTQRRRTVSRSHVTMGLLNLWKA